MQLAFGIASANASLIEGFVIVFVVMVCKWLSKKFSKEEIMVFEDGDIDDELYEIAHERLCEAKKQEMAEKANAKA